MSPQEDSPRGWIVTEEAILSQNWSRRAAPFYSVHEVANVFFRMSVSWLRLKLKAEPGRPRTSFVHPDGTEMIFRRRDPKNGHSARVFTLADVERMAWSLRWLGDIKEDRLNKILAVVKAEADLFGLLSEPGDDEAEEAAETGAAGAEEAESA